MLAQLENWPQDQSGVPVVDTGWFPAALYVQILAARAALAQKLLEIDPGTVNKYMQQTLDGIALREASIHSYPCAPPSECTWFEGDLPAPVGRLVAVTGIGMQLADLTHYTYREWTELKYTFKSRYEGERTRGYYTEMNNKIFVVSKKHEEVIRPAGIFYDPVEAERSYKCTGPETCKRFLDYPLYIAPEHVQLILSAVIEFVSGARRVTKYDFKNDAIPIPTQ